MKKRIDEFFAKFSRTIERRAPETFTQEEDDTLEQIAQAAIDEGDDKHEVVIDLIGGILEKESVGLNKLINHFIPKKDDVVMNWKYPFKVFFALEKEERSEIFKLLKRNLKSIVSIVSNRKAFADPEFQAKLASSDKVLDFAGQFVAQPDKLNEISKAIFIATMPKVQMPKEGVILRAESRTTNHLQALLFDSKAKEEQKDKLRDILSNTEYVENIKNKIADPDVKLLPQLQDINASDLALLKQIFAKEKECKERLNAIDKVELGNDEAAIRQFLTNTDDFWFAWFYLTTPQNNHKKSVTERYVKIFMANNNLTEEEARKEVNEKKAFFDKHKNKIRAVVALEEAVVRPKQFENNLIISKDVQETLKVLLGNKEMRPLLTGLLKDPENLKTFARTPDLMVSKNVVIFLKDLFGMIAKAEGAKDVLDKNQNIAAAGGLFFVQSTPWFQDVLSNAGVNPNVFKLGGAFAKNPQLIVDVLDASKELTNPKSVQKLVVSLVTLIKEAKLDGNNEQIVIMIGLLNTFLVPALGKSKAKPVIDIIINNLSNEKDVLSDVIALFNREEFIALQNAYSQDAKNPVPLIQAGLAFLGSESVKNISVKNKEWLKAIFDTFIGDAISAEAKTKIFDLAMANISDPTLYENLSKAVANPNFLNLINEVSKYQVVGDKQKAGITKIEVHMLKNLLGFLVDPNIQDILKNNKDGLKPIIATFLEGIPKGLSSDLAELILQNVNNIEALQSLNDLPNKHYIDLITVSKRCYPPRTISDYTELSNAGIKFMNAPAKDSTNKPIKNLLQDNALDLAAITKNNLAAAGFVLTKNVVSSGLKAVAALPSTLYNASSAIYNVVKGTILFADKVASAMDNGIINKNALASNIDTAIAGLPHSVADLQNDPVFEKIFIEHLQSKKGKISVDEIKQVFVNFHENVENITNIISKQQNITEDEYKSQVREQVKQALKDEDKSIALLTIMQSVPKTPEPSSIYSMLSSVATSVFYGTDDVAEISYDKNIIKKAITEYLDTGYSRGK